MPKKKTRRKATSADQLVRDLREIPEALTLSGRLTTDRNFRGRQLLVVSDSLIYSLDSDDIIERDRMRGGFDVVRVREGAQVWRTTPAVLRADSAERTVSDMEWLRPPPPPKPRKGDPKPADLSDSQLFTPLSVETKSIAGAAAKYDGECAGGDNDAYQNNCAHFLSDAFIRAGYSELRQANDCVNARCGTPSKRVIRARDMWCWFQKMAKKSRNDLPKNDGFWAVFQLKESVYWGGHVVIIDTAANRFYGTGNYPNWDQHAYQW